MDASTKPKDSVATKAPNNLVKSFRLSGISFSVFANQVIRNDQPATFYKTAIQKTYRDGDEFITTTNFEVEDLPTLCLLLMKAFDFIGDEKLAKSQV